MVWVLPVVLILILQLPDTSAVCSKWYNIKEGDNCYEIQKKANIDEATLQRLNPGLSCDKLQIGDALCLQEMNEKIKCLEEYTVKTGDYCFKIRTDSKLSERQFNEINPGLNCDALQIGQKVCIRGDWKSDTPTAYPDNPSGGGDKIENLTPRPPCDEKYDINQGDSCDSIATNFATRVDELKRLNPFLNCTVPLEAGLPICVFETSDCQTRHKIVSGDTCYSLKTAYRLSDQDLLDLNGNTLNCNQLQVGRQVCVWSMQWRYVSDMSCERKATVSQGNSCWSISTSNGITVDELLYLNPRLNCSALQINDNICVQGKSSAKCAKLAGITTGYSCEDLQDVYSLSVEELLTLNPTLDCEHINRTAQICVGLGYYDGSKCINSFRIQDASLACSNLTEITGISLANLQQLNPYLDCKKPLNQSSLVCIESLGGMQTGMAREKVIDSLKGVAPEIVAAYQEFLKNPTYENSAKFNDILSTAIIRPEVYALIKKMYKTDQDMKKIMDSGDTLNRDEVCTGMKDKAYSQAVKDCFCNKEELMLYCRVRASKEMQAGINESEGDHLVSSSKRKKRADEEPAGPEVPIGPLCQLSFPGKSGKTPGKNALDFFNSCFGGGCTIPLGYAELSISADICIGPLKIVGRMIQFCKKNDATCKAEDGGTVQGLQVLLERTAGARIKLCLVGASLIKKLAKYELGLCFTVAAADYTAFVGKLSVYAQIQAVVIKIKGGVNYKVHDLPYEQVCDHSKFECEDFCLWKFYNSPAGSNYGFLKITAFEIFGLDGFTLMDEKFNNPSKAGCNKGKKAAIIMMNKRKCKNDHDNQVWRRCFSRDDTIKWELLGAENGFDFGPKSNTVFACEFVDMNEQKIGFEVYGSKSNKGAKNFYYEVRNDGVYFGKDKDAVDKLKGKWDKPCDAAEEKKEEDVVDSIEPTGKSKVPAASCGKRIVGYYTGWGEREIARVQLEKVTHVIFAFVATQSDGSIGFGAVSNDADSKDAGAKAEQRFNDLRKKVRDVEAGVKMMFAVGGWDNSQYFSSIAADSGKRKRFVDSIADFLKKHKIDGVDVDWEYPVTGGAHEGTAADKANYVTLLKDLRNRLTELKKEVGRQSDYEISLASAAGEWTIRPGYDLSGILQYANFINVMTYDYYGAWESKWGAYTGPPAPLYYGSPKGFSGKLNADFSMKYYACRSKKPSQLNMGVPFYGRFWNNVGDSIDGKDDMWRTASAVNGKFDGGFVGWRNLRSEGWNINTAKYHDKVKSPYIFDAGRRKFLGFENEKSLEEKKDYAIKNNLGGLMIWALDQDDDSNTLLNIVSSADLCSGGSGNTVKHKCVPIDDIRWWNPENGGESKQGMCGKSAPLINGYYPVCDPDDPGYACCGKAGYCGSEKEFCDCDGCFDYRTNPDLIVKEPTRPTRDIQWYLMDAPDGQRGRCGKGIPLLNGKEPICNPDDPAKHCCSNGGYCGTGKEFCECNGCVDYKKKQ